MIKKVNSWITLILFQIPNETKTIPSKETSKQKESFDSPLKMSPEPFVRSYRTGKRSSTRNHDGNR